MANSHRGEVDVTIAGKTYPVAMTLDALARVAAELNVKTMGELEERVLAFDLANMKPVLAALLAGSGHQVPDAELGALHWRTYVDTVKAIWNARPGEPAKDEPKADPQKRAK